MGHVGSSSYGGQDVPIDRPNPDFERAGPPRWDSPACLLLKRPLSRHPLDHRDNEGEESRICKPPHANM